MVTTRNNARAASGTSEEPVAATSPMKQTHKKAASSSPAKTKSKPGRKRKPEELAPESSKADRPAKQPKKVTVEDVADQDDPKKEMKQMSLEETGVSTEPQEENVEEVIEEGIKDTEMGEAAESTENNDKDTREDKSEEQLKAESKSAVSISSAREKKVEKSPILEKGVVYFFFRPKVSVEHAESLDDVQRSYLVLRPLPLGAKLKDGKIPDEGHNRLIAIPKKKLPTRGYERFLTFVEEPKISIPDLKSRFLTGSTYMTKTQGERKNSAMEPVGEGIYAITKSENERSSHLAYILTLPSTPDELQKEFGLKERGSFVVNVRNPQTPSPPQAGIPDPAEFPKEIMDEFEGRKWGAMEPKHLDYKHAEVLFIGEKEIPKEGDHKATAEEMEKLEDEDEMRVKHLGGDEAVFADLELGRKEFAGVESTW